MAGAAGEAAGGWTARGFDAVRRAFSDAHAGDPGGAQLSVYRHGEPVVDLWRGVDPVGGGGYRGDTLTVLMSCTKGAVAVLAHRLIERGVLDPSARVADYWPEFAHGGKEGVRVRHVLSHSAGLAGFEPGGGIGAREVLDWGRCVAALESMTPLWEPGSAYLYHFVTWGFLVGELIRRVTGLPVGEAFSREIAEPLNLDLWIGLPEAEEHRVAPHFRSNERLTAEGLEAAFVHAGIDTASRLVRAMIEAMTTTEALIDLMTERAGRAADRRAGWAAAPGCADRCAPAFRPWLRVAARDATDVRAGVLRPSRRRREARLRTPRERLCGRLCMQQSGVGWSEPGPALGMDGGADRGRRTLTAATPTGRWQTRRAEGSDRLRRDARGS